MTSRMQGRIARMETLLGAEDSDLSRLTWDELQMLLLDVSRVVVVDPSLPPESCAEAARNIVEIEGDIRHQAIIRAGADYDRHIAWVAGERFPDYVPCVCTGSEHDGLDKPSIMERRTAILAREDVQALIAETAQPIVSTTIMGG